MTDFSPARLQVMWNRLLAVVEEQGQTLIRAAFSPIVRECGDISAGIFDVKGRMLAQAVTGTPGHINTMAEAVKTLRERFPIQTMQPGDIYMTNDPWLASGHLNDFLLMMPAFKDGRVIGFTSCTSHLVDLGGLGMGPEGSDIYDEGLLIPPCKLVDRGAVDALLMDIVKANSREPIANEGDIYALIACCEAGAARLVGMMGCLIRAFAGPGDEVLGTDYVYLFVATACLQAGAGCVKAVEPDFTVSVDALLAEVSPRTRIVFLCNPGNPTGTRMPNAEIVRLRDGLPADVLLVVDQAYGELDDQDPAPVFALAGRGDTVVLRTFSKAYALAGARVGWGLFPEAIGHETCKLLNPNNVSAVSQAMAAAAMRDQAHMRAIAAQTAAIRDQFAAHLVAAGYPIPVSHTNFVLIPFGSAQAANGADRRLRAAGLLLRGMAGYGLPQCLRATIAAPEHMARAAEILATFKEDGHDR